MQGHAAPASSDTTAVVVRSAGGRNDRDVVKPGAPIPGVGVLIFRDGAILLGRRIGSHGAGTWSPPGGHLEFGESVEACARREVREETGLELGAIRPGPYTNDVFADEGKHYVTLFVLADAPVGEPQTLEPDKCAGWQWFPWTALPGPLFLPLANLRALGLLTIQPGSTPA